MITGHRRRSDMDSQMTRAEFLKGSLAVGALAALGEGLAAETATGRTMPVTEVDSLRIWVLTDNYFDSNRPDGKGIKRFRATAGRSIHAEHGVSFYAETVVGARTSAFMFDFGLDPVGVANNVALLGLDLGKAGAFCLSHGHYDHFTSALSLLGQNRARIAEGTPFLTGEEAFLRRYALRPGAAEPTDLGQLEREKLEALKLTLVEVRSPRQIVPGAYFTGPVQRVTPYEKVPQTFLVKRGEKIEPDLFPGEQGVFFAVKGKGLVVLSGCAHCGIVNTVKQAQRSSGIEKVHAVMGGFHLINAKPDLMLATIADVKGMKPDLIVPAHCTGFEAVVAFAKEMPDQFVMNTAGTQYTFAA
jgi:7,8-dihydropterin-6-yl-methyl-4-(beta-D-ribofuranosyl)aminobenzene 5'-phosphate synthase